MRNHIRLCVPVAALLLLAFFPSCKSGGGHKYTIPGIITGSVEDPTGGFADSGTYLRDVHVSLSGSDSSGDGSQTNPYASLNKALSVAISGDKIILAAEVHGGGTYRLDVKGTFANPIMITGDPAGGTVIDGGTNCMQLGDAEYVVIQDIEMRNATGNGLNMDDGGSFDTPAHHIVLRRLYVHNIGGDGNQDGIKLSGLEYFLIDDCEIAFCGGAMSGSLIDMVGCHHGQIQSCNFHDGSGNAIQAKGATEDIYIWRNRFESAGARALNLGGSTGAEYFRPQGANYEARNLNAVANVFVSCEAPICFVGCDGALVANNTIYLPNHWVLRILQESVTGYIPCRNGRFLNNIIVFNEADLSTYCNVGPDTAPDTFTFSNNLWHCLDNPGFTGPTLPVTETDSIYQQDPDFADPLANDFHITSSSPAAGKGVLTAGVQFDCDYVQYESPPSIGAFEVTN
ncbi:MAG: right-handed parallel beta-helix repeat-containing protein [Planctomycetota bacterium]